MHAQVLAQPLRRSLSDGALRGISTKLGALGRLRRQPSDQLMADVLQQQHALTLWQVDVSLQDSTLSSSVRLTNTLSRVVTDVVPAPTLHATQP
jgi:hypothetical protein